MQAWHYVVDVAESEQKTQLGSAPTKFWHWLVNVHAPVAASLSNPGTHFVQAVAVQLSQLAPHGMHKGLAAVVL